MAIIRTVRNKFAARAKNENDRESHQQDFVLMFWVAKQYHYTNEYAEEYDSDANAGGVTGFGIRIGDSCLIRRRKVVIRGGIHDLSSGKSR